MRRGHWDERIAGAQRQGSAHECMVDGCEVLTLAGFLACREHWLALPRRTRWILGEAFRRHDTHPDVYDDAVALARQLLNEQVVA